GPATSMSLGAWGTLPWGFVVPLSLLVLGETSFVPRPFSSYESGVPEKGQTPNIRHFRHREDHRLEDGSEFALHWDVDTDPDTLLELDLEQGRGVKVLACRPDHLRIQVHGGIVRRLEQLRHVTASEAVHGCKHLVGHNLYHRVEKVSKVTPMVPESLGAVVEFDTKELETAQEVFQNCKIHINAMPARAMDPEKLKMIRQEQKAPTPRRLTGFVDWMKKTASKVGDGQVGKLNFGVDHEMDPHNADKGNSFFDLNSAPEADRFHWNWNYKANSTQNPQYKYTFPGGTAWLRLFKPYVDAHVGFSMNISSQIPALMQPPHVVIDAMLQSVADMDLDVGMAANFDKDSSASVLNNVLDKFNIPVLSKMKADSETFMRPMTFHIGGTPVSVTPGYSVNMKIFHIGRMKGTMRVGLATKLLCQGTMHFDTAFGAQSNFSAKMLNVSFTPPTWLLFTEHFQLGVMLEPSMWLKGGFGAMKDMEMGFGLRPYFNVSVLQQNPEGVTDL
ncbi:unnamed protein product, partial [Polarella glacialis]